MEPGDVVHAGVGLDVAGEGDGAALTYSGLSTAHPADAHLDYR